MDKKDKIKFHIGVADKKAIREVVNNAIKRNNLEIYDIFEKYDDDNTSSRLDQGRRLKILITDIKEDVEKELKDSKTLNAQEFDMVYQVFNGQIKALQNEVIEKHKRIKGKTEQSFKVVREKARKRYNRLKAELEVLRSKALEPHRIQDHTDTDSTGRQLNRLVRGKGTDYVDDLHSHDPEKVLQAIEPEIQSAISRISGRGGSLRLDVKEVNGNKIKSVDTLVFSDNTVVDQGGGKARVKNTPIHVGDSAPTDLWEGRLWIDTS